MSFYDRCYCIRCAEQNPCRNGECPRNLSQTDRAVAHRKGVALSWADFTGEEFCKYVPDDTTSAEA